MSSGYASTSVYAAACSASRPTWGPLPWERTSWCSWATEARAGAADRTLVRWFSAVIGSPRLRRALPPSATTTRIGLSLPLEGSVAERGDHDGLDGVEPVLGLVEDDRALGLEDVVGHLEAVHAELLEDRLADLRVPVVEGRQAVHELHLRVPGPREHVPVDLVRLLSAAAVR